jgi:ABC-2 type transport system permease protein
MMAPGSTLWLMAHELRLAWRAGGDKSRWARLALFGVMLLFIGGAGWPLGLVLREHQPPLIAIAVLAVALIFGFVTVMVFTTALSFVAASFVDRGDIDLLLSSPLPMRRPLTVRLVAAALRSIALWMFLFGPPVVIIACVAGPRWLGGLALLVTAALLGTTAASLLALGMFRVLGPKRVKTTATIITALSGLTMGLLPALSNVRMRGTAPLAAQLFNHAADLPALAPDSLLALPARAAFGDPLAAALLLGPALAVFLGSTWLLAPAFSVVATRGESVGRPTASKAPLRGFGTRLYPLLLIKDYRLLLRNHALLLQILARSIAFVPLLAINLSRAGHGISFAQIALAATLVLGQVGGALVWAFICAETQPDLLASAPLPARLAQRSRLAAALMPALALVLLVAAFVTTQSPRAGLAVLVMATGGCLCSAAINVTAKASPVRRSAWGNAPRPSIAAVIADMIGCGFWSGAAYLLSTGSIWTALPVWLALSTVWLWREIVRREA